MSLPVGVVRRPPALSPNPAPLGGLIRLALRLFLVMLPFLLQVAMQIPGTKCGYQVQQLRAEIAREHREQQLLRAEIAALRAPDRLRAEADRLGLMPAPLNETPRSLVRLDRREDAR